MVGDGYNLSNVKVWLTDYILTNIKYCVITGNNFLFFYSASLCVSLIVLTTHCLLFCKQCSGKQKSTQLNCVVKDASWQLGFMDFGWLDLFKC